MTTRQEVGKANSVADKPVAMTNLATFVVNFLVVGLSNFGLIGKSQARVSAEYPTLVTPFPLSFSIWGLIYQLELAFVIWQALPANKNNPLVTRAIGPWFAVTNLLQAAWAFAFAQEKTEIAAVLLILIALSLGRATMNLATFRTSGKHFAQTWPEFITHNTFGLHAGWTFVAAALNINVVLQAHHASATTQLWAAVATLLAAAGAGAVHSLKYQDTAFNAATVWALVGIYLNPLYRRSQLSKSASHEFSLLTAVLAAGLVPVEAYSLYNRNTKVGNTKRA